MNLLMSIDRITADIHPRWTRREALSRLAGGFGAVALARELRADANPFAPKATHFPAKAKRIVYLVMNGGMSHVDTFDPKPMLVKHNGQPVPGGAPKTERSTGSLFASPFAFERRGQMIRAMLSSPQGRELRLKANEERQAAIRSVLKAARPDLRGAALTRLCAAVQLLSSASGWATMTDYWGLDSIEAGRAASEAIAALLKPGRA